jgi:HK97 gp10 family phage protein
MARAPNKSVAAFRKLTVELQRDVFNDAIAELNAQADGLVTIMKAVVARGKTGKLADTIRKEPGKRETQIRVRAGGSETTEKSASGSYDYARAVEFGTEKVSAQPFFFPTYRLRKKAMQSAMRRKITKTIKKYSAE